MVNNGPCVVNSCNDTFSGWQLSQRKKSTGVQHPSAGNANFFPNLAVMGYDSFIIQISNNHLAVLISAKRSDKYSFNRLKLG